MYHKKISLDEVFHVNETLDHLLESVRGLAALSIALRAEVSWLIKSYFLELYFRRLVTHLLLIVIQYLATLDYFLGAILTWMNTEIVPNEQLSVEAAEHYLFLDDVPHVEELGYLYIANLVAVFVAGLVHLDIDTIQFILDVFLHDSPLVVVLLCIGDGLLHVKNHSKLAELEKIFDILLEPLNYDSHVVAGDSTASVATYVVAILEIT